jgi:hypothetical protein
MNTRTLTCTYTKTRTTLGPRDYEGVPWADEDEDMASVRVGVGESSVGGQVLEAR